MEKESNKQSKRNVAVINNVDTEKTNKEIESAGE